MQYMTQQYKAVLQQYIEKNDNIGAEFLQIYFMNEKYTVAASYFDKLDFYVIVKKTQQRRNFLTNLGDVKYQMKKIIRGRDNV